MALFKRTFSEEKKHARVRNRRVHMANERTFLAWIRTSIGIMAFGFIIEKFVLLPTFAPAPKAQMASERSHPLALLGVFLVSLGAAAGLLATYRFIKTEKEIMKDTYHPSIVADVLVAILIASIGILLILYLLQAA